MRSRVITCILLFSACNLYGQVSSQIYRMTIDTILLEDVTVSYTLPLDDKQIEKFYKTNYFSTIDNLMGHLDGVSLIKRGAYAMEPQMNGFSGGQLNITIDGMRMFGACTDKMDPVTSYLEPSNLMGITLNHGTNGSIHGNNTGGSIDLALKDPPAGGIHPLSISPSFGYESVSNGRNLLLSAGYTKNKWAFGLNGAYRKNDPYRAGNGEIIEYSQFEKYNIHTVVKYSPDTLSFLRTDLLWDNGSDIGYPALPMDVSKARAGLASIEYQRKGATYDLQAKIYYNSVYHLMDDSARDSLFFTGNPPDDIDSVIMRMDMPGWSSTAGSYVQVVKDLNKKNRLTVKADSYLNKSLAEMTMYMHFTGEPPDPPMYLQTWPDILRSVTGIYLGNTTTFNRKFSFTVNGRLDYNLDTFQSSVAEEQFSVFNYQLADKYSNLTTGLNLVGDFRIRKPFSLSVQTGFSERIPTISERYGFYLYNAYDGYDYIGNPSLKTEKSVSARFSATYFRNGLKINLSQSVSFLADYIMGITDTLIPPMNFYTYGLRVYQNVPGANLCSTDLQVMYTSPAGFSLFNRSRYTWGQLSTGDPLPLIPPLKNQVSVSYERKGWAFQADNETAFRQNRINTEYRESMTPFYTLFNIKASRHIMLKEAMIDCSAGITNLLDRNYHEHLDWGDIPRPGRSFNIFIKYTY